MRTINGRKDNFSGFLLTFFYLSVRQCAKFQFIEVITVLYILGVGTFSHIAVKMNQKLRQMFQDLLTDKEHRTSNRAKLSSI